jgi:hypothetical protein
VEFEPNFFSLIDSWLVVISLSVNTQQISLTANGQVGMVWVNEVDQLMWS